MLRRRIITKIVLRWPDEALSALGWSFASAAQIPAAETSLRLDGFEHVAPLVLSSNAANRGLASMRLNEAAHLWGLAASLGPSTLVEIGRERGGTTILLAAGMSDGSQLHSYDPQTKLLRNPDQDVEEFLARSGLAERVHLHVADSHEVEPPADELGLILIDGDASYHGIRLDHETFCTRLRSGGHALFHDATAGAPRHDATQRLLHEVENEGDFERQPDVGTLAHLIRR